MPAQSPVTCHLCGDEVEQKHLVKHLDDCEIKWNKEQEQLPKHLRRPPPSKQAADSQDGPVSTPDHYENTKSQLVACGQCGRTFFPDRLSKHEPHCKAKPVQLMSLSRRTIGVTNSTKQMSLSAVDENNRPKTATLSQPSVLDLKTVTDVADVQSGGRGGRSAVRKGQTTKAPLQPLRKSGIGPPQATTGPTTRKFGTPNRPMKPSTSLPVPVSTQKTTTPHHTTPRHHQQQQPSSPPRPETRTLKVHIDDRPATRILKRPPGNDNNNNNDKSSNNNNNNNNNTDITRPVVTGLSGQSSHGPTVRHSAGVTTTRSPLHQPCYICGQPFSARSLTSHQVTCLDTWTKENDRRPKHLRRPTPVKGNQTGEVAPSTQLDFVKCRGCDRTFAPHRLETHERVCLKDSVDNPYRHQASQPYLPVMRSADGESRLKNSQGADQDHKDSVRGERIRRVPGSEVELVTCSACGRTFRPDRLEVHQRGCRPDRPMFRTSHTKIDTENSELNKSATEEHMQKTKEQASNQRGKVVSAEKTGQQTNKTGSAEKAGSQQVKTGNYDKTERHQPNKPGNNDKTSQQSNKTGSAEKTERQQPNKPEKPAAKNGGTEKSERQSKPREAQKKEHTQQTKEPRVSPRKQTQQNKAAEKNADLGSTMTLKKGTVAAIAGKQTESRGNVKTKQALASNVILQTKTTRLRMKPQKSH